ncbi:LysR family transcriptional regulator [Achromobacter sp. RTa]|uniref:MFS transporter n=1 Tax=Achromobacter sp. RTa TaxID=1532557 RepID=UPI00050EA65C|nr:MFS transporter [Achromobacter sp. RTa]KGD94209.1 LysR family transcriptional regulator [Achromobacter sp. RTa]
MTGPAHPPTAKQPVRAAAAAFIGTTIEWYDFYIYATAAALVFGKVFFPAADPFVSTMASFGTFAAGFLARPLGGLVFGHLGDRIGRKNALMATLIIMGVATVGIGLLPGYEQAGLLAPALLLLLRLAQGLAVGGEWGGAVLMAGEHASQRRRTFAASFAQLGSPAGLILSLVAFRLITTLDEADFLAWGWRIPFLVSAVLLAVGYFIRIGVSESPDFAKVLARQETLEIPAREVMRTAWRTVLLCMGVCTVAIGGIYFTNTFMLAYTTQTLGLDRAMILDCLFAVAIIQFFVQPLAAWFAESLGTARVLIVAAACSVLAPYPMFMLVSHATPLSIVAGIAIVLVFMATIYSAMAGFISSAFDTHVRYSGISLSYQLCGAIAGGFTPLVGTWLSHRYPGQWMPLALFYSGLSLITLVSIWGLAAHKQRAAGAATAATRAA